MQEDDFAFEPLLSSLAQSPTVTPAPQAPTLNPPVASPTLTQAFPPTDGVGGTFIHESWDSQTPVTTLSATEGQVPAL